MAATEGVNCDGLLLPYQNIMPVIDPTVYIAQGAVIVGDVTIGQGSSVWFNAVVRGDVDVIRIGERTNIQDGSVLHVRHKHPLRIGSGVTIGHGVVAHGCTIHDFCLLGMGCRVLDNAVVESFALVAAGALVREGQVVPEGALVAGVPARVVRMLTDAEREELVQSADHYCDYARHYRDQSSSRRRNE